MKEPLRARESRLRTVLESIPDPAGAGGLVSAGRVLALQAREDGAVFVTLEAPFGEEARFTEARAAAEAALTAHEDVTRAFVTLTAHEPKAGAARLRKGEAAPAQPAREPPRAPQGVEGVSHLIAVSSAKGGVGKSTVAVNLAVALSRQGLRVGLLDADVYGPSAPTMLGLAAAKPEIRGDGKLEPIPAFGLKTMSIGYLVEIDAPMIWRGPMATSAIRQMLDDVAWAPLDVIVIDMPPGTGDVQLTIAQRLPLSGAVIVSTPQEVALADVRRGVAMFERTAIPILGVVETMAWLDQADGSRLFLFGEGGAERTARAMGAPFLGAIPLSVDLRESADAGRPLAAAAPEHPVSRLFADIARAAWANLDGATKPPPAIRFV